MHKTVALSSLWFGCVQSCARHGYRLLGISTLPAFPKKPVYSTVGCTTLIAQLFYSTSPTYFIQSTPVTSSLIHTIHRTYNYLQQDLKKLFIISSPLGRSQYEA